MDVIRRLTPDHRAPLQTLLESAGLTAGEKEVALEVIDAALNGDSDYRFALAIVDGLLAGYVCHGPAPMTDGAWNLYWIAVEPGSRNDGMGRTLLRTAEGEAIAAGARMMLIETESSEPYVGPRRLSSSGGYFEAARIEDFWKPGSDKIIYRKDF